MAGHAGAKDDRGPLVADFRAPVHRVIVHPKGPLQGFEVEVKGKLAALVGGGVFPEARYNSGSYLVAEERLAPHAHFLVLSAVAS
jgi:site-specific DNA recombinase